ncbi:hypothetical protein IW492_00820 [Enterococcus sp. BWB1-3]|uniref:hypothetical protein n=1 Tax=unclassified Enterococcus TaxID=2608891 RepID=UPI001924B313|nr:MULTISPECIES: hypothetical protein [unclassified Enterococcus]MBL1227772.1 hypothetical protein [Enterococcus sp. BWB1-3]MCB5952039.1 hypothetical protein [Enterococcus sp. BWT-B8]MCB5954551.1 hypothetical protein [Enterococcus sp. CWB-B31]
MIAGTLNQLLELFEAHQNSELQATTFILSYGNRSERCYVKEFYGKTFKQSWEKLFLFYRALPETNEYVRIDLIIEESKTTLEQLIEKIGKIKRNNYITFGFRVEGFKKRCFLKEEITSNALFVPDENHKIGQNLPNLRIDISNYKSYVKRKYRVDDYSLNYLKKSSIYTFTTQAYFIEENKIFELKDYGFGNHFRVVEEENFQEILDDVIRRGAAYLLEQLKEDGKFIYGYFPCYDKNIRNYNAIRHFSSLYALFEAGELLNNQEMIKKAYQGLIWGFDYLLDVIDGDSLIKDQIGSTVEYKLGAQATAILASAKYTQITGDTQFFNMMRTLAHTIEKRFITENDDTIHVLDKLLEVKDRFRIIYYDGEALFSMLRAYELMNEEEIFNICQRMMTHFVDNNYEKYHDHWLSYAVNEFLKHEQKNEYYTFGLKNALSRIDFMENRDTAYPTMLELLVAAAKMVLKLDNYDKQREVVSAEEFTAGKKRIFEVMDYRAYHEIVTGTMFPEFAMFFQSPEKIQYGFFARHDRFRMRIDDAEHFLSGLINYRVLRFGGVEE